MASVDSPDLAARRSLAHATGESRNTALVLPIYAGKVATQRLEAETSRLEGIHFENGWADGLKHLLAALDAAQCPKDAVGPTNFVLETFMPANVLVNQPETLAANIFPVSTLPIYLKRWEGKQSLSQDEIAKARLSWAFRKVDVNRFISFCEPPADLTNKFGLSFAGRTNWNDTVTMDGIRTRDLAKELLRRSMEVACASKGLVYWPKREFFYFPQKLVTRDWLTVRPVEGKDRRVGVVGERTFGVGKNKSRLLFGADFLSDLEHGLLRNRTATKNPHHESSRPDINSARRTLPTQGHWGNVVER